MQPPANAIFETRTTQKKNSKDPVHGPLPAHVKTDLDTLNRETRWPLSDETHAIYLQLYKTFHQSYQLNKHLGCFCLNSQNYKMCYKHFKYCVQIKPEDADCWKGLGLCLFFQGQYEPALIAYKKALGLGSNDKIMHFLIGRCYVDLNRPELALQHLEQALTEDPNYVDALYAKANAYNVLGDFDKATIGFEAVLEVNPNMTAALSALTEIGRLNTDKYDVLSRAEQENNNPTLPGDEQRHLFFAAATEHKKRKNYDQAFMTYKIANECNPENIQFDISEFEDHIDKLIEYFDQEIFADLKHCGLENAKPIFILGMPRSGTTLIEQIISSHQSVEAGGEIYQLSTLVENLKAASTKESSYPQNIKSFSPESFHQMGELYLAALERLSLDKECTHITDKMPFNFLFIGLIKIIFPEAKIVHCVRNPIDTCLSCYFQNFTYTHNLHFSSDLKILGRYHNAYKKLMHHWHGVLPNQIHNVCYEELVGNQEQISKNLFEYLSLKWTEDALSFFKNKHSVLTASHWQVRQPIYNSAIGKWRPYEKHLGPLLETLNTEEL
ncbi:MAG: sulfotransferase [Pseudomonadota bacterium]